MTVTGFDLETHLVQPGLLTPPIVLGSVASQNSSPCLLTKSQSLSEARRILESDEIAAGANIAFDWGCLCAEDPSLIPLVFAKYKRGEVHDVLISQTLDAIYHGYLVNEPRRMIVDPRTGKQIKDPLTGKLSDRYTLSLVSDLCLGRADAKKRDKYRMSYALFDGWNLSLLPPEAAEYPLDDAINSRDVAIFQRANNANQHDLPTQAYAAWCAHLGAIWGIRTDRPYVREMTARFAADLEEAAKKLVAQGLLRPDGSRDTKAIMARVSAAYGGNPPLTDGGKPSTANETLEASGDDELLAVGEYIHSQKMISTYLEKLDIPHPLCVSSNILLATGRASYEGIIQLFPRKGGIRESLVARDGHALCSVDFTAVEMSTWAQEVLNYGIESELAKAINAGMDPHCILTGDLMGVTYEEALAGKKGVYKDPRQGAKAGNFGLPGGMGVGTWTETQLKAKMSVCECMGRTEKGQCGRNKVREWNRRELSRPLCSVCLQAAQDVKNAWMRRWTEAKPYFKAVQDELDRSGNQIRQSYSNRIRGGLRFTQACNTRFQGLAADIAKRALIRVCEECYLDSASPLFGSRVLIFTHDELILEIPVTQLHDASARQTTIMVEEGKKGCPDVKISAEPAAMLRWCKDAEPVYVDGKLVVWSP
jgi:DNA polymerase I